MTYTSYNIKYYLYHMTLQQSINNHDSVECWYSTLITREVQICQSTLEVFELFYPHYIKPLDVYDFTTSWYYDLFGPGIMTLNYSRLTFLLLLTLASCTTDPVKRSSLMTSYEVSSTLTTAQAMGLPVRLSLDNWNSTASEK